MRGAPRRLGPVRPRRLHGVYKKGARMERPFAPPSESSTFRAPRFGSDEGHPLQPLTATIHQQLIARRYRRLEGAADALLLSSGMGAHGPREHGRAPPAGHLVSSKLDLWRTAGTCLTRETGRASGPPTYSSGPTSAAVGGRSGSEANARHFFVETTDPTLIAGWGDIGPGVAHVCARG